MKLDDFITAVTKLVETWQPSEGDTLRKSLAAIYDEVREEMAHDLAEAIRVKNEALEQLHRHHIDYHKKKKP
jgi:hypothetical protein